MPRRRRAALQEQPAPRSSSFAGTWRHALRGATCRAELPPLAVAKSTEQPRPQSARRPRRQARTRVLVRAEINRTASLSRQSSSAKPVRRRSRPAPSTDPRSNQRAPSSQSPTAKRVSTAKVQPTAWCKGGKTSSESEPVSSAKLGLRRARHGAGRAIVGREVSREKPPSPALAGPQHDASGATARVQPGASRDHIHSTRRARFGAQHVTLRAPARLDHGVSGRWAASAASARRRASSFVRAPARTLEGLPPQADQSMHLAAAVAGYAFAYIGLGRHPVSRGGAGVAPAYIGGRLPDTLPCSARDTASRRSTPATSRFGSAGTGSPRSRWTRCGRRTWRSRRC